MFPLTQFNSFVKANGLFTQQSKLLLAVSGGMDSVYLAHLLNAAGYHFGIAHCNFQLRGDEATADERFCEQLANSFDVPFHNVKFDTEDYAAENKISIQMAARDLRYQWFEQIRAQSGYDVIVTAHHQNDVVETMLLNLARGTGIAGLHGIKPKNGHVVRPLLFLTRADIAASVKANKIDYREDSSNSSLKYARNKIRHEVVPALKELNPDLEQTFIKEARHFAELEQLLQMQLGVLKETIFIIRGDEIWLPIVAVKQLVPLHLLLFGLLNPYGFSATTVADIIDTLSKHPGRTFEAEKYKLVHDREHLIISPLVVNDNLPIKVSAGDKSVYYGKYRIGISISDGERDLSPDNHIAQVDADKLTYPLSFRKWQHGDSFYPLGMKTKKKLSDFFISQKIPLHKKEQIPLLVNANGDIIWVSGYRICDKYKLTEATKKIAIFELTEFK